MWGWSLCEGGGGGGGGGHKVSWVVFRVYIM